MNKFSYMFFPLAFALISSCQEEIPQPAQTFDDAKKALIGEWVWEETIIKHRGQEEPIVQTPKGEGKIIIYTFNKEGKMVIVENGTIRQESDYEIVLLETSATEGVSRFGLNTSNPVGFRFFNITQRKLYLFDGLGASMDFRKR